MNEAVVRNAIGSLEVLLGRARDALWSIEWDVFGNPGYGERGGYESPEDALASYLEETHDVLLVVLEAADMPKTRSSLIKAWRGFKDDDGGLAKTIEDPEHEVCISPALNFLDRTLQGLRASVSKPLSTEQSSTLSRLEAMLRNTSVLVHRREASPANEMELQKIMHDYLRACFPDFRFNPDIGGTLKTFKPDCGIASVGAAIEFKVVHTKENVAVAFSGVAEDTAGYRGSKDWTRFFAVIYQAQPWIAESELQSDLKRIGAATWTPILVNGPTKPKRARRGAKKSKAVQP